MLVICWRSRLFFSTETSETLPSRVTTAEAPASIVVRHGFREHALLERRLDDAVLRHGRHAVAVIEPRRVEVRAGRRRHHLEHRRQRVMRSGDAEATVPSAIAAQSRLAAVEARPIHTRCMSSNIRPARAGHDSSLSARIRLMTPG